VSPARLDPGDHKEHLSRKDAPDGPAGRSRI